MYKILIIAREPSGDNLGSKLIKEMKIQFNEKVNSKNFQNKKLLFQGIGGFKMQNEDLYVFIKLKNYQLWVFLMFLKVSEKFIR